MASAPLVRFVYLAEPIDQDRTPTEPRAHRTDAAKMLTGLGVGVYRPSSAFYVSTAVEPGPEITDINDHALATCDAVLAFLPHGQATVGVPMEIDRSMQAGKPTAVVTDSDRSWSLYSNSPNLRCFITHQDAVQWLLSRRIGKQAESDPTGVKWLPFVKAEESNAQSATLPTRGFADDAGLDLYVSEDTKIDPGTFVDVPTSVACGFPPGVWGLIIGRSSTLRQRGLMVNQGVIDPGYRGPLFAGAWNLTQYPVRVKAGERIAQMILLPSLSSYSPHWVGKLPESHDGRGGAGFGSTG